MHNLTKINGTQYDAFKVTNATKNNVTIEAKNNSTQQTDSYIFTKEQISQMTQIETAKLTNEQELKAAGDVLANTFASSEQTVEGAE